MEGFILTMFALAGILGLTAMSYGVFISSLARNEFQAFQASFASFFPARPAALVTV